MNCFCLKRTSKQYIVYAETADAALAAWVKTFGWSGHHKSDVQACPSPLDISFPRCIDFYPEKATLVLYRSLSGHWSVVGLYTGWNHELL